MKIYRDTLEKMALKTVSAELYYDLADNIDSMSDVELYDIIECGGNYKKEQALYNITLE